jgi:uncharacterized protein (TIGR00661 family)
MARIVYSLSGEGRGHATRVRTMVELLRGEHELLVLAPGDAYALLEGAYHGSEVRIQRLPGLRFAYNRHQKVSIFGTGVNAWRYLMLPYIALDHQSFATYGKFDWLPGKLRFQLLQIKLVNWLLYHGQRHTISSSFFRPEVQRERDDVTFVGSMLRPQVRSAENVRGEHITAYCRRTVTENVLESLAASPCEVRLYGLGEKADRGSIRFRPISEDGFVADLASGRAVVANAGNQLLGETLYLGKPMLALPEEGQHEQLLNSHVLERLGGGRWCRPRDLTPQKLRAFLDEADAERPGGDPAGAAGPGQGLTGPRASRALTAAPGPRTMALPCARSSSRPSGPVLSSLPPTRRPSPRPPTPRRWKARRSSRVRRRNRPAPASGSSCRPGSRKAPWSRSSRAARANRIGSSRIPARRAAPGCWPRRSGACTRPWPAN